jgi:hypothetical protein
MMWRADDRRVHEASPRERHALEAGAVALEAIAAELQRAAADDAAVRAELELRAVEATTHAAVLREILDDTLDAGGRGAGH